MAAGADVELALRREEKRPKVIERHFTPYVGGIKKPSKETGPKKAAFSADASQHGRTGEPFKHNDPNGSAPLGRPPCSPVLNYDCIR